MRKLCGHYANYAKKIMRKLCENYADYAEVYNPHNWYNYAHPTLLMEGARGSSSEAPIEWARAEWTSKPSQKSIENVARKFTIPFLNRCVSANPRKYAEVSIWTRKRARAPWHAGSIFQNESYIRRSRQSRLRNLSSEGHDIGLAKGGALGVRRSGGTSDSVARHRREGRATERVRF